MTNPALSIVVRTNCTKSWSCKKIFRWGWRSPTNQRHSPQISHSNHHNNPLQSLRWWWVQSQRKEKMHECQIGNSRATNTVKFPCLWYGRCRCNVGHWMAEVAMDWGKLTMKIKAKDREKCLRGYPSLSKTIVSLKTMLKKLQGGDKGFYIEFGEKRLKEDTAPTI